MASTDCPTPSATAEITPLTCAELEQFIRRARHTFLGDQCAYEATEDLRGLADAYGLR